MKYFNRFLERKDVRHVIAEAMQFESVQGVVLELDHVWLRAWRVMEMLGPERGERILLHYFGYSPLWFHMIDPWMPSRSLDENDIDWSEDET